MMKAILFDLDNTLLSNDVDCFVPAYMKLVSSYAADLYEPGLFVRDLLAATEVMASDDHPAASNEDAFWTEFSRLTGLDRTTMIPFFTRFYQTRFGDLRELTQPRPEARPLVAWAFSQGYAVAIATNPLFPRVAIEQRLDWAGVRVEDFDYDLITAYENSHSAKPHRAYYEGILARLECDPAEALMVGDDWEMDIAPAAQLGIKGYWITPPAVELPDAAVPLAGRGTLADLWALCSSGRLEEG